MNKNITLRLDQAYLRKAREEAVSQDLSLSQWVADLITNYLSKKNSFQTARTRALKRMNKGFHLGGKSIPRESLYD